MAAEGALNTKQFGPWTEKMTKGMADLERINRVAKQRRAGKPDQFGPGVSDKLPIRSPQNWY